MTDREVMQMALDALEKHVHEYEAIQTLRTALAQPEPEPVAWWHDMGDVVDLNISGHGTPLYTAPPQRESTCAECEKKASDGWALYCVACLREFYKHDPTTKRKWVGMNREDIIRMAQEAGWTGPEENVTYVAMLERFANLVAAAECEACAKFIEQEYVRQFDEPWRDNLAKAIRARREQ